MISAQNIDQIPESLINSPIKFPQVIVPVELSEYLIKDNLCRVARFLITCIILIILSSCKKEATPPVPKFSPELLTSTIWGDDTICGYSRTAEVYSRIFAQGGSYYEYRNGYQSMFGGTWRLKDSETLVMNNDEFTIMELNENKLRLKSKSGQSLWCVSSFTALTSIKATTLGVSALSKTSVRLHGYVRNCALTDVSFEYWDKTAKVNTVVPANNSFIGPAHKKMDVMLSGLNPETVYLYKIKAVDPAGTNYGQELTFRTYNSMILSDADSNVYHTLTIGSQLWMAENLRTTKYNDGTEIPEVRDNLNWTELNSPGYCWYENDSLTYKNSYGALYNWHTVNTGKLCPAGWRTPNRQDWTILLQYLGENAGDILTEGSFDNMASPIDYIEASNESGFSAKETGVRGLEEYFFRLSVYTLWSKDEENAQNAWRISISPAYAGLNITNKKNGLPVRCLKD